MREHGNNFFSGACINCTCADGLISCIKYHVTIQYGLFRVETVGNCMPCCRPSEDIMPTGNGTASACQGLLVFAINAKFRIIVSHVAVKPPWHLTRKKRLLICSIDLSSHCFLYHLQQNETPSSASSSTAVLFHAQYGFITKARHVMCAVRIYCHSL